MEGNRNDPAVRKTAEINSSIVIDMDEIMEIDGSPPKLVGAAAQDSEDVLLVDDEDGEPVPVTQDEESERQQTDPEDPAAASGRTQEVEEARLKKMLENEVEQRAKFRSFKTFSNGEKLFPDVRVSDFHRVLFQLSPDGNPTSKFTPYAPRGNGQNSPRSPSAGADYVPFPSELEDKVTIKVPTDEEGVFAHQRVPIWDVIRRALQSKLQCSQDIENAIRLYFKSVPTLNVLQHTIEQLMTEEERSRFFSKVLPEMVRLCLMLPDLIRCPLPFLRRFRNYSISLHQIQISSLLANAFFSTFRDRPKENAYASINFYKLFSCDPEHPKFNCRAHKIRCILHYFERIAEDEPTGVVTFTRKSMRLDKFPSWDKADKKIRSLAVLCEGTIEDTGRGMLQVDFANRFVGGGVLGGGAVQEEILFVIYPELLISRLFTENLAATEALVITGCERFSSYAGYASGFKFAGDYFDATSFDPKRRKLTQIIAIDALYIQNPVTQFHPKSLTRELNKAYVGFHAPVPSAAVATGKWGCGAFNGDPQLKGIIQLLAASQADKDLVYFTFGDMNLQQSLVDMFAVIKDMNIGQVWNLLKQYYQVFCTSGNPSHSLAEFFQECLNSTLPLSEEDNMEFAEPTPRITPFFHPNFYTDDESIPSSSNQRTNTSNPMAGSSRQASASAPCSSATTPILQKVEGSKNFSNWLTKLDSVKASMTKSNKNKTSDPIFDDLEPDESEPVPDAGLTDKQILDMLDEEDDTGDIRNGQATSTPNSNPSGSAPSTPTGKVKRRNQDEREESTTASSSKKAASTPTNSRQTKLQDFYKSQ